jgi:murein DD-endopeptidase MepM/ murein hydrolase activator NlpD
VGSSGWALPAYGPITDGFGYRADRPAGANPFHRGTDIGAGCGSSMYAAHAGTVIYAGWLGTYGNFIEIDNGGGVSTGYAHVRPGGTFVHVGQQVSSGQNIASVGMTGAATGCHLHFEVRINEVAVNAVPFLGARGITIG